METENPSRHSQFLKFQSVFIEAFGPREGEEGLRCLPVWQSIQVFSQEMLSEFKYVRKLCLHLASSPMCLSFSHLPDICRGHLILGF